MREAFFNFFFKANGEVGLFDQVYTQLIVYLPSQLISFKGGSDADQFKPKFILNNQFIFLHFQGYKRLFAFGKQDQKSLTILQ